MEGAYYKVTSTWPASWAYMLLIWLQWGTNAAVLVALVWQCCFGRALSALCLAAAFYLLKRANHHV